MLYERTWNLQSLRKGSDHIHAWHAQSPCYVSHIRSYQSLYARKPRDAGQVADSLPSPCAPSVYPPREVLGGQALAPALVCNFPGTTPHEQTPEGDAIWERFRPVSKVASGELAGFEKQPKARNRAERAHPEDNPADRRAPWQLQGPAYIARASTSGARARVISSHVVATLRPLPARAQGVCLGLVLHRTGISLQEPCAPRGTGGGFRVARHARRRVGCGATGRSRNYPGRGQVAEYKSGSVASNGVTTCAQQAEPPRQDGADAIGSVPLGGEHCRRGVIFVLRHQAEAAQQATRTVQQEGRWVRAPRGADTTDIEVDRRTQCAERKRADVVLQEAWVEERRAAQRLREELRGLVEHKSETYRTYAWQSVCHNTSPGKLLASASPKSLALERQLHAYSLHVEMVQQVAAQQMSSFQQDAVRDW